MKKTIIFICFFLFGAIFASSVFAETVVDPNSEHIESYDVVMNVNQDSSVNVSETIKYNFDHEMKPGFSRFLPLKYQDMDGANFEIKISNISVADETGKPYQFKTTKIVSEDKTKADLEIAIGNSQQSALGSKTYVIKYRVRGAIEYFSDHDQFFWNITGNKWPVYIKYPSLKVNLPRKVDRDEIDKDCFIGLYSNTTNCINRVEKKKDPSIYYSYKGVVAGEGMALILRFPKGIVQKPTDWQNFKEDMNDNWNEVKSNRLLLVSFFAGVALIIAIITFIIIFRKRINGFFSRIKGKIFRQKSKSGVNEANESEK